jgi:hypothetical protein
MANVPLIDEGTGNGGGGVHDGRCPGLGSFIPGRTKAAKPLQCEPQPLHLERRGIPQCFAHAVIPGRGRHLPVANPESQSVWLYGDSHVGIPGSVPSPSAPLPPRNDSLGQRKAPKHFFLSSIDTISIRFIFPSVLPHREGRSRSSRSRGGMRWTPEMRRYAVHGNVCLRAGRICASTATGKETADLGMERPLDSVTDDQVKTRSAYSLEAPCPFALGL